MLALRTGERVNLMVEAGRCEGRASTLYKEGLTGAPCIQIGSFNCPVENEEEMHAGYIQQRLPAMCETASCVRTRKLNSVAGWAKHAILYEFATLEGFNRDYEAANAKSPLGSNGHSVVPLLVLYGHWLALAWRRVPARTAAHGRLDQARESMVASHAAG